MLALAGPLVLAVAPAQAQTDTIFGIHGPGGFAGVAPEAGRWPFAPFAEPAPLPWNFGGAEHPPLLEPGRYVDRLTAGDARWLRLGGRGVRVDLALRAERDSAFAAVPDPTIESDRSPELSVGPDPWVEVHPRRRAHAPGAPGVAGVWMPLQASREPPRSFIVELIVLTEPDRRVVAGTRTLVGGSAPRAALAFKAPTDAPLVLLIRTMEERVDPRESLKASRPTDGAAIELAYQRR